MLHSDVHKTTLTLGPIGNGYVQQVRTSDGTRFVARWQAYVASPDGKGRKRVTCGPYELGPRVAHGPGLRSVADARKAWDKVRWEVFNKNHPPNQNGAAPASASSLPKGHAEMRVADFIATCWEPRREAGWEENSRGTYAYIRDAFIVPFFREYTIRQMNDEDLIKQFMQNVADRKFSDWTAHKCFNYTKSILDLARDLGLTTGNAARVIPAKQRIPKGVKRSKGQPSITVDQYAQMLEAIKNRRDKIILKILFLCALRRGEVFPLKWKDLVVQNGMTILRIERSYDSHTHKVKEWSGKVAGPATAKVVVPPKLAEELQGWKQFGDTNGEDPEGFMFPTRNGTCLMPRNWTDDVLKPAARKIGVPEISYHWFRRGHATVQHHGGAKDKAVQAQLRHADVAVTQNVYMQQVEQETYDAVAALEATTIPAEPQRRKPTRALPTRKRGAINS